MWDGACLQAGAQKSIVSIIPQPLSAVKASMQVASRFVFLTPESRSCTRLEELTNDVWFEVKGRSSGWCDRWKSETGGETTEADRSRYIC